MDLRLFDLRNDGCKEAQAAGEVPSTSGLNLTQIQKWKVGSLAFLLRERSRCFRHHLAARECFNPPFYRV